MAAYSFRSFCCRFSPKRAVDLRGHAEFQDLVDFRFQDFFPQAVFRNSHPQHSPQHRQGFEHRDPIPHSRQVIGAGHSGGARADDGHFFRFLFPSHRYPAAVFERHVRHEALQGIDGNRLVEFTPVAGGFAGVVADPPADPGKRAFLLEEVPGFQDLPLPDQNHGPLDVLAGWAAFVAGGNFIVKARAEISPGPGPVPFHGTQGDRLIRHILFRAQ